MIKRRSTIEPTIGHMKSDGKLGRNWLKGALGDALHSILCGAGHNIRLLLRRLRRSYTRILMWLFCPIENHGIGEPASILKTDLFSAD